MNFENNVEWYCSECDTTMNLQHGTGYHDCSEAGFGTYLWVCQHCDEVFEIDASRPYFHNCSEYCHRELCTCFTDVNIAYPDSGVFVVRVAGGVAHCTGSLVNLAKGGKRRCNCGVTKK